MATAKQLTFDKPRLRARLSADGLTNVYTSLGTENSQNSHNTWSSYGFLTATMVDVIFRESWLAQAICCYPAEDACRQWRRFTGEHAEDIERVEKKLNLQSKVTEAKTFARAYGGAGLLMVTDQPLDKPLEVNKIKKGSLKKLLVLDRYDLSAPVMNMTNPLADNYLLPEYYTLVHGSQRIHWTHLARFNGIPLPRRLAQIEQGWGDSELRKVLQDMNMVTAAFMGVGQLMQQANVDIISREGLSDELTTGEESAIIERFRLFNLMKSNLNLSLLDSTEELKRLTLQLTGVSQTMEQLITWASAFCKMPTTRLFGASAKGMNATGEGDENVYNDRIKSIQERELTQPLNHLDQVMVRSALGNYPDDTDFNWNPLTQLDDEEQANVDYTDSQTDRSYFDMNIVKKSQIAKRLQAKDRYEITDDDIIEIEDQEKLDAEFEEDDDFTIGDEPNGNEPDDSTSEAA